MITASDAVLAAVGFLGFGAAGLGADGPVSMTEPGFAAEADPQASPDLLSAGEPYFEAVAAALRRTGYLDS
ncbi:hypothetical protein [Methylobacterium haplocladii]|uniref:Uncharacterized protein n=1 Tax=Methylobacterium haplocladii TaxID=1176176 RepID=A0A512INJ4_9HYPH|nr:hypothetical protein [Methylobacterium haplocladii]GEO99286.1 hypothetical protein MHA02_16740 [Methylobacterium haplocladii]GJD83513.1 hypothetical protein HPGCJGGD_1381 [Methylobacterium haplocladii]GLS59454.1 hypothetical protein GCM10007887_21220 [Methylobacterium haplocladii]